MIGVEDWKQRGARSQSAHRAVANLDQPRVPEKVEAVLERKSDWTTPEDLIQEVYRRESGTAN